MTSIGTTNTYNENMHTYTYFKIKKLKIHQKINETFKEKVLKTKTTFKKLMKLSQEKLLEL